MIDCDECLNQIKNLKECLEATNYLIDEISDALAATDDAFADIQRRVAQLENHTAVPRPHPPVHDASAVIKSFDTPTVDELHDRIAYLEKELAATNAEANRAGYEENKLRKRVADLKGQL